MTIQPTFNARRNPEACDLWAVCYPEHYEEGKPIDILTQLFRLWNDRQFLQEFFKSQQADLATSFWSGISIEQAIEKVMDEAADFEDELMAIEYNQPGYENKSVSDIFEELHKVEFLIKPAIAKERHFRKAKPYFKKPMLRIYGLQLECGTIIITGGGIKLTDDMDRDHLQQELTNLRRANQFLKEQAITTKEGLEL